MNNSSSEALQVSSFGQLLRMLRLRRGYSQLQLSEKAKTTPRHISFIETGRSRPGRDVVLRVADALNLTRRELNLLLTNAGIASEHITRGMSDQASAGFLQSARALLDKHSPCPAYAVDTLGRIVMTNDVFERLVPGRLNRTAEQSVDDFFGSHRTRDFIENWAEVAWTFIDCLQLEAVRRVDPRLIVLSERALAHMTGVERPPHSETTESMFLKIRFRLVGQILTTNMTVLRYENVNQTALGELRLKLFHPTNQKTADAFVKLLEV